jgi:solute carrier family 35 protein
MLAHVLQNVEHLNFAEMSKPTAAPSLDGVMSDRLLIVCTIVVLSLGGFWFSYAMMARLGKNLQTLKLILLCLSFASCSWGMNVLNKALVQVYQAPSLVTAAQMMMTVIGTLILARNKLTGETAQVLKWSFVPLLFFGMLVSSFFTYEYLTLSMLMVIRNLGPMVTLPIERMVMPVDKQPVVSSKMIMALIVILSGALVYAGHIQTSLVGFAFALLNMFLAIADRVAQRRLLTSECKGLSTETCMLLNNLLGCIPTVALGYGVNEFAHFDSNSWFHSSSALLLLLSGLIGSGICYFAIAVQREISATSFMVLQNAARMAVVVAGVLIFHDPLESVYHVTGLMLSFGGAIWYGQTQLEATAEAKKKAALEAASDPERQKLIQNK